MLVISYIHVIIIPVFLFLVGITGFFINRKNIIIILMSIELILLAANINLILAAYFLDDLFGILLALFVLTVAAAESAVGLAILVVYYRITTTIAIDLLSLLKG